MQINIWHVQKKRGEWVYGKKVVNSPKFKVIYNAIDFNKFKYNKQTRERIRKKLDLENKIVLGNVGNFIYQKNHTFLIDVFKKLLKKNEKYHLLLIGKGDNLEKIKKIIDKNNFTQHVTFLGVVNNVEEILQAMDVFLLPSKFEGLPFAALEAQASGVSTIISDTITDEVVITDNITRIPLNKERWEYEILNIKYSEERKFALLSNARNFMYQNSKEQYIKIID